MNNLGKILLMTGALFIGGCSADIGRAYQPRVVEEWSFDNNYQIENFNVAGVPAGKINSSRPVEPINNRELGVVYYVQVDYFPMNRIGEIDASFRLTGEDRMKIYGWKVDNEELGRALQIFGDMATKNP